jgi:hypothetical protein
VNWDTFVLPTSHRELRGTPIPASHANKAESREPPEKQFAITATALVSCGISSEFVQPLALTISTAACMMQHCIIPPQVLLRAPMVVIDEATGLTLNFPPSTLCSQKSARCCRFEFPTRARSWRTRHLTSVRSFTAFEGG